MDKSSLYPLLFEPLLSERPWGGRDLEAKFGKPLPPNEKIGESWEIYGNSIIANGTLAGHTLREALVKYGDLICPGAGDDFPLLVKFLDAREWLSVQVHPNDEQAQQLEGEPRGKTECWYVLYAEPGAKIAYGVTHEMTADEFRAAVAAGKADKVMAYTPVKSGDFVYVPAGTPHALGPGILIYELQQSSDITYRVYDWDRVGKDGKPRELHLEKALAVMDFHPRKDVLVPYTEQHHRANTRVAELWRGQYFGLHRITFNDPQTDMITGGVCQVITVIKGSIQIQGVTVNKGYSTLIPAALEKYVIEQTGGAEILHGWPT